MPDGSHALYHLPQSETVLLCNLDRHRNAMSMSLNKLKLVIATTRVNPRGRVTPGFLGSPLGEVQLTLNC